MPASDFKRAGVFGVTLVILVVGVAAMIGIVLAVQTVDEALVPSTNDAGTELHLESPVGNS